MTTLLICCSLTRGSKTNLLAHEVLRAFQLDGQEVDFLELSGYDLPLCDGRSCYAHPDVLAITERVAAADCIVFCAPVYVYDLSAAAKNLVELTGTGSAWFKKTVGFACMAGTVASFMAVMPFANSLMLDYKCVIVPKFVYVTAAAFTGNALADENIRQRLACLATDVACLGAVSQTLSSW